MRIQTPLTNTSPLPLTHKDEALLNRGGLGRAFKQILGDEVSN